MDKVQKIREEVARIQLYTQSEVLKQVLDYIDKVQEEPVSNSDWLTELQEKLDNATPEQLEELWNKYNGVDEEEPVSEELKVELEKYIKDHFTIDTEQLDRFGIEEKDYMYSMDKSDMLALVEHFINCHKTKEEPVSENLEKASKEWLIPQLDKSYANYGETKMMELTHFDGYAMLDAIEFGANWQKNHLWKSADGDDLPDIDREVIALLDNGKVVFAHRPPEYWDGKDIVTGKVTRNYPKTYDKGGWNIPNIVYWLDVKLPKEIEL